MNESLKFSDYITTETVHAAFAGATDIAKAGYKIAHNLPRAVEPAGAIIHDYIIVLRAER